MPSTMKVCLNGAMVDAAKAPTLTSGIREVIAVKNGAPKRIGAHLARLRYGLAALNLSLPYSDLSLGGFMAETLIANVMMDAVLHVSVGLSDEKTTLVITAAPLPLQPTPAKVVIAAMRRDASQHRVKLLHDPDGDAARSEAVAQDVDDAVLLNTDGRVAGGTSSNVFMILHGGLVTPPLSEGAFPGTVRGDLVERFRAEERQLTLEDLGKASEIFLTNALGLRPVLAVNGNTVGDGETGLVSAMLATRL